MDILHVTERLHRHLYGWQMRKPMNNLHCCHDMLWDARLQALPGWLFKAYHNLLCLAAWGGNADGRIQSSQIIAKHLGIRPSKADQIARELIRRELLETLPSGGYALSDWSERRAKSGNSTERMRRLREKRRSQKTILGLPQNKIANAVTVQKQPHLQIKSGMGCINGMIQELDEAKVRLTAISDKSNGWDLL